MSTSYTWTVDSMVVAPTLEGHTDVVTAVNWRCTGTDGTTTVSKADNCPIPFQGGTFVAYPDLTLDEVLGWLDAIGINRPYIQDLVQEEITAQTQVQQVMSPPWIS